MLLINNKSTNVRTFGDVPGLVMLPGVNRVDQAAWAKLAENTAVKALVGDGVLVVENAGADAVSLVGIKARQAVELVADTFDRPLLLMWRDAEKRRDVIAAIDKQVDAISLKPGEMPAAVEDAD